MAYACNPSTQEAEAGGSIARLRPAWNTQDSTEVKINTLRKENLGTSVTSDALKSRI